MQFTNAIVKQKQSSANTLDLITIQLINKFRTPRWQFNLIFGSRQKVISIVFY